MIEDWRDNNKLDIQEHKGVRVGTVYTSKRDHNYSTLRVDFFFEYGNIGSRNIGVRFRSLKTGEVDSAPVGYLDSWNYELCPLYQSPLYLAMSEDED